MPSVSEAAPKCRPCAPPISPPGRPGYSPPDDTGAARDLAATPHMPRHRLGAGRFAARGRIWCISGRDVCIAAGALRGVRTCARTCDGTSRRRSMTMCALEAQHATAVSKRAEQVAGCVSEQVRAPCSAHRMLWPLGWGGGQMRNARLPVFVWHRWPASSRDRCAWLNRGIASFLCSACGMPVPQTIPRSALPQTVAICACWQLPASVRSGA